MKHTLKVGKILVTGAVMIMMTGCANFWGFKERVTGKSSATYDGQYSTVYEARGLPDAVPQLLTAARQFEASGDQDQALYYFVQAYDKDRTSYDAILSVGRIHAERRNIGEARTALRRAIQLNPAGVAALEELGILEIRLRRISRARTLLERAATVPGVTWRTWNGLGVIADLDRDHTTAMGYYNRAFDDEIANPEILNNMGYSAYLAGNWEQASRYLQQALMIDPTNYRAQVNTALISIRRLDFERAVIILRRSMSEPMAHRMVGEIAYRQGSRQEAIRHLTLAMKLSPTYDAVASKLLSHINRHPMSVTKTKIPQTGS